MTPIWMISAPTRYTDDGETLTATAVSGSDFWRKTHYGFIHHNGHLYAEPMSGNFILQVTFRGNYHNEYDQAGLMLFVNEETWLKTGIEYTEGRYFASAVVTRDFSDWAVAPLPATFNGTLSLQVKREDGSIEIFYREHDADPWTLLRVTYLSEAEVIYAGRMLCAPMAEGFEATFTNYSISKNESKED